MDDAVVASDDDFGMTLVEVLYVVCSLSA